MGSMSDRQERKECEQSGRIEEYNFAKQIRESKKSNIAMYEKNVKEFENAFNIAKKKYPPTSEEYNFAKNQVLRWKYVLDEEKEQLKFVRPNSKEDIKYRESQGDDFCKNLLESLPKDLDIRFHGTPIYFAKKIIEEKGIYSSADRYDGYIKSTDRNGEISASRPQSLSRTVDFFSDLSAYQRSLPAGAIFALRPKDEEDANYDEAMLHSVDFTKNPEQLYGIFTTPENVPSMKEWMEKSKMNPDLVCTFEEFLDRVKNGVEIENFVDQEQNQNNKKEETINDLNETAMINTKKPNVFTKLLNKIKERFNIKKEQDDFDLNNSSAQENVNYQDASDLKSKEIKVWELTEDERKKANSRDNNSNSSKTINEDRKEIDR